jgi:cytochrome c oxidase cbb3-type subunit I/II
LPGIVIHREVPVAIDGSLAVKPYTALELEGRDVYVAEGCYTCHSQMIRPFRSEALRYGEPGKLHEAPSRIEESMWDRPFQWGSKRTGPDLARIGSKYTADWHWQHMIDPRSMHADSNMPAFPWLATEAVDHAATATKLKAMQRLGVPYSAAEIAGAQAAYHAQADGIAQALAVKGVTAPPDSKLVALIGYLLRLGKNQLPAATATGK